eukprot:gene19920-26624_t
MAQWSAWKLEGKLRSSVSTSVATSDLRRFCFGRSLNANQPRHAKPERPCGSQLACYSTSGVHAAGAAVDAPVPSSSTPTIVRDFSSHIKGNYDLLQALKEEPKHFADGDVLLDSIIKIYTVSSKPNHFLPWQNHPKGDSTGTGTVIHA